MNSTIDKTNPLKMKISRNRDLKRRQILSSPIPVKRRKSIRVTISSIHSKPVVKSTTFKDIPASKSQEKPKISNDKRMEKKDEYSSKWLLGLARHLKNKINPSQLEKANACLEMMKDGFVINEAKHSVEFLSYLKSQFARQVSGTNGNTYDSLKTLLPMTRSISILEINQLLNDNICIHWTETHFETVEDYSELEDF